MTVVNVHLVILLTRQMVHKVNVGENAKADGMDGLLLMEILVSVMIHDFISIGST